MCKSESISELRFWNIRGWVALSFVLVKFQVFICDVSSKAEYPRWVDINLKPISGCSLKKKRIFRRFNLKHFKILIWWTKSVVRFGFSATHIFGKTTSCIVYLRCKDFILKLSTWLDFVWIVKFKSLIGIMENVTNNLLYYSLKFCNK